MYQLICVSFLLDMQNLDQNTKHICWFLSSSLQPRERERELACKAGSKLSIFLCLTSESEWMRASIHCHRNSGPLWCGNREGGRWSWENRFSFCLYRNRGKIHQLHTLFSQSIEILVACGVEEKQRGVLLEKNLVWRLVSCWNFQP